MTALEHACRVIRFDKRGTGLSDPTDALPSLDQRVADLAAVMDAAGSQAAVVFGVSDGGPQRDRLRGYVPGPGSRPGRIRHLLPGSAARLAGQSILVNGAGGAVGGYAVQLAGQAGATVTATVSARSPDRIRSYGADRIIDYTATPLPQAVAGQQFDVVLNLVRTSPEETAELASLAADGGAFVDLRTSG